MLVDLVGEVVGEWKESRGFLCRVEGAAVREEEVGTANTLEEEECGVVVFDLILLSVDL